ncbi:MAG: aminotransferase class V-fold PLP-dependent enzyme [Bacteroidota bacterium]
MSGLLPDIDPNGLLEYSVVFSDRSLNHMSEQFQLVMRDISSSLKEVYQADGVAVVPGGGTYAMEAVARQLATAANCLIVRNGWFSYRWSQILDTGSIAQHQTVLKAQAVNDEPQSPYQPASINELVTTIQTQRPDIVFAPHVETSAGLLLPDDYLKKVAEAVREVDGLFVLDCIASGALWVDMKQLGIDVLISAPQKGWSSTPGAGLVMMSERAIDRVKETTSSSFACNLKQWYHIMQAYEQGGHAYHATLPTDALKQFRDVMIETQNWGLDAAQSHQVDLGQQVRQLLEEYGFPSVAASGYQAPSVVVSYTDDPQIHDGTKFKKAGIQIAKGVPLACDESDQFQTFRVGLFGLDKLQDIAGTIDRLRSALSNFHR